MGLVEKSEVTAFLDKYYEEHPLDNSFEGIIARRSGLKKETVAQVLDYFDVVNFTANYNPSAPGPATGFSSNLRANIYIEQDSHAEQIVAVNEPGKKTIIGVAKRQHYKNRAHRRGPLTELRNYQVVANNP